MFGFLLLSKYEQLFVSTQSDAWGRESLVPIVSIDDKQEGFASEVIEEAGYSFLTGALCIWIFLMLGVREVMVIIHRLGQEQELVQSEISN